MQDPIGAGSRACGKRAEKGSSSSGVVEASPQRLLKPVPQGRASKHGHTVGLLFPVLFNSCLGGGGL